MVVNTEALTMFAGASCAATPLTACASWLQ